MPSLLSLCGFRRAGRTAVVACAFSLLVLSGSFAQSDTAPSAGVIGPKQAGARTLTQDTLLPLPASRIEAHVHNYGELDGTCIRWTDGCRNCDRAFCSNIGIACQPAKIKCVERREK